MPYTVKTELHFYLGQVYALKNDKFTEPYFVRFDEIFIEDIDLEISKLQ